MRQLLACGQRGFYLVILQPTLRPSSPDQINDYLIRFKSRHTNPAGSGEASESALDQFLLERAAAELLAASEGADTAEPEPNPG